MKYFDDDMDELFDKAGRQYPLKTEPKDWDKVRAALLQEQGAVAEPQKRNGWRRLLPLLLLLLIPAVYIFIDKGNVNKENIDRNTSAASEQVVKDRQMPVTKKVVPVTKEQIEITDKENTEAENSHQNKSDLKRTDRNEVSQKQISKNNTEQQNSSPKNAIQKYSVLITADQKNPINKKLIKKKSVQDISDQHNSVQENAVHQNQDQINKTQKDLDYTNLNLSLNKWNEITPFEAISLKLPVRSLNNANDLSSVPNAEKKFSNNKKRFYVGIEAAPDRSTIKGQKAKPLGYSAGIVAGYYLNKRWSLEAGLLWSKKNYFTSGKYFSKAGAQIPDNINIHWLNGGCDMLEVPIVVRYNFSLKKNTFFGAAGFTSYIMKKENYKYAADAGAGGSYYEGHRNYDRSGDHLFANLQLSAGYKYSLSSKLNIRIEPYLKIPVKKIGIGKMPITSTGLFIGITRDIR